jgi:glycosyltransferase involved in cell wall biosynthesis
VNLSIVIPFRASEPRREELFNWIHMRFMTMGPEDEKFELQILVSDSDPDKEFNRSQARNRGASHATADHILFADADTLMIPDQIFSNLRMMRSDGSMWIVCQQTYYIATNETTDYIISQEPNTREDFREMPMLDTLRNSISVAGGYMVSRDQFESVGGYDERFNGWGYEDTAFLMAMETLWDYSVRPNDSYVIHLEHPATRFDSPNIKQNEALFNEYMIRQNNRDRMLELIKQSERHI